MEESKCFKSLFENFGDRTQINLERNVLRELITNIYSICLFIIAKLDII